MGNPTIDLLLGKQFQNKKIGPKGPREEREINNFVLCPRNFWNKWLGFKLTRKK